MFGLATYSALVMVMIVGTLRRPAFAFAGVLCMYGLKQWGQSSSELLVRHRTASNLLVGALVLIAIAILAARSKTTGLDSRMPTNWKLIVALYAYAFLTLAFVPDFESSLHAWTLQWPYVVTFVVLAPFLLNRMDDVRHAIGAAVIMGGAICALALFAGNWGTRGLIVLGNIYELETNPLAIASLGGTVFLGTLFLLKLPQPLWRKILLAALIPIAIAVMFRSQSRGQLGAAALAAMVGWLFISRKAIGMRMLSLAVAAVLVGSIGWWVWDQLQLDANRWSGDLAESDAEGRFEMARALLSEAARSPVSMIFGLGNSSSYHYLGSYPHITPLEVLAEEGLLGMTLYTACLVATLVSAARVLGAANERGDTGHRVTAAAVLSLFLFELMLSMKQGTFLSSTYVFAYAAIIGRMAFWPAGENAGIERDKPVQDPPLIPANLMR